MQPENMLVYFSIFNHNRQASLRYILYRYISIREQFVPFIFSLFTLFIVD